MTVDICYECNGQGFTGAFAKYHNPYDACDACDGTGHIKVPETVNDAVRQSPGMDAFEQWCDGIINESEEV